MKITIKDRQLAADLRALAAAANDSTVDEFVSRMLRIAIDAAVEAGKRREAEASKARG